MENKKEYLAKTSMSINASPAKVWDALINPKIIKKYFFGTEVETDWKPGSTIRWQGEYEGKKYEDKGEVLEVISTKKLQYTYWSSMSGKKDTPENYVTITCAISKKNEKTVLTFTQDNNHSEKSKQQSIDNWKTVLKKIKSILEEKK
ncbi:MAG: SRPBCC family protein [Bacteroidota bacterium]